VNNIVARHLFCFIFPFLFALYLLPILIKTAFSFKILDNPDGNIKNHKKPVPYLGGFALYIPFIATLAIAYPFENQILWLLLGTSLLLFVGFIDDLRVLKPYQKFLWQILAVICFLKGGYSLKMNFFSDFSNLFFSGFWMISIINAFNLIDVMDGLATITSIFAGLSFLVIAFLFKQYALTILILAFLAPLIVFFFYNKPPAKIYLGDAGSMFIGGFFAAIPQLFNWSSKHYLAYYAPVIILAVPLLELFFLVVIRTVKGIPFYKGSPHHFSIYLRKKLWSVKSILAFISVFSVALFLVAFLFLFNYINFIDTVFAGIIFFISWVYFIFI
jgi:UDP-GlcNAc:undecaprenyl-phosphate/decaprenyl-phosphate GlcNAc-1-phosphate transferase